MECYDPKEDRWTFIAPMRTPRARFQMAVLMVPLLNVDLKARVSNSFEVEG